MPHMNDPIFSKSLIYICEHDKDGSMGLIINKPMISENAADIIQQTGLAQINPLPDIYFGGPVNLEMGLILHNASYTIEGTLSISKSVALTSNKKIVADLKNGDGPSEFRFSFGYACWGKGQLEREIENGDWLLQASNIKLLFDIPSEEIWEHATKSLGININDISNIGGMA